MLCKSFVMLALLDFNLKHYSGKFLKYYSGKLCFIFKTIAITCKFCIVLSMGGSSGVAAVSYTHLTLPTILRV